MIKTQENDNRSMGEIMWDAGHDFHVDKVNMFLPNGTQVPDKMATVNVDGDYLGTVGKDYTPVQPSEFYALADAFRNETGARIASTITMKGGAVIGINFNLNTREYIPGDPVEMHFLMLTSFNMQYSVMGRALSNRLACLNQLPSSTKLFDIKHTRFVQNRLGMALKMLGYFNQEQLVFDSKMKSLANYSLQDRDAVSWFESLFGDRQKNSKRSDSILKNNTATFVELLTRGKGTELSGVRGTAYGALNGLTEYVNHHRSTRVKGDRDPAEVKYEATLFGSGQDLMQKGFNSLVEMVKSEPSNKFVPATLN